MKKIYKIFTLSLFFFLIVHCTLKIDNCYAQWVLMTNGTVYNKNINTLVASGNTIFAGTEFDGVYKSTNNGLNWVQTSLNN
jgi:hypothetical protein